MPIYEIECPVCGKKNEVITTRADDSLVCPDCGAADPVRLMSATSGLTGKTPMAHPGPNDRACCGSTPSQAGCAGPGSCCGHAHG